MMLTPVVAQAVKDVAGAGVAGNPFPQINTFGIGVLLTLLGILVRYQVTNRKMTIQVNGEVRAEFIAEMERVRRESNDLRQEINSLRTENNQLRKEVSDLTATITGMARQNAAAQRSTQRTILEALPVSPEINRALTQLGNIEGDAQGFSE